MNKFYSKHTLSLSAAVSNKACVTILINVALRSGRHFKDHGIFLTNNDKLIWEKFNCFLLNCLKYFQLSKCFLKSDE